MAAEDFRFYVYQFIENDQYLYIGKGSHRRLKIQERRFGITGQIMAYFMREKDAHLFEMQMISEHKPLMNKTRGGEGFIRKNKRIKTYKWEREMERIGTKCYAARLLLKYQHFAVKFIPNFDGEEIRRIANC